MLRLSVRISYALRKALTKLLILRGFAVKKVTGQVEKEWPISPSNPIYEI